MMARNLLAALNGIACLSMVGVVGCGGSDSGGGGLNSGVDPSKPAEEVTDEEAEQVCRAVIDYSQAAATGPAVIDAQCRLSAIFGAALSLPMSDAALQEACAEVYDGCKHCAADPDADGCDFGEDNEPVDPDEECMGAEAPASCNSTVGEIEACFEAEVDNFAATAGNIPQCSELTLDSMPEQPEAAVPAECEQPYEECPEVFE